MAIKLRSGKFNEVPLPKGGEYLCKTLVSENSSSEEVVKKKFYVEKDSIIDVGKNFVVS